MHVKVCCENFKRAIRNREITSNLHINDMEIYLLTGGYYMFYCPFCGKKIEFSKLREDENVDD